MQSKPYYAKTQGYILLECTIKRKRDQLKVVVFMFPRYRSMIVT